MAQVRFDYRKYSDNALSLVLLEILVEKISDLLGHGE